MTFDTTSCIPSDLRGVENATELSGEQSDAQTEHLGSRVNGEEVPGARAWVRGQALDAGSSDEFLFERLRDGDHGALALLFRRYARMVRGVAYRILRDAAEADDLLQEVFLFLFRKWALFDASRGSARSWIVQVTYHRAIDRRRHLLSPLLRQHGTRRDFSHDRWTDDGLLHFTNGLSKVRWEPR